MTNVHVMIDIETLGQRPGCAVTQIGACLFDPWAEPGTKIGYQSMQAYVACGGVGHIDWDTLMWHHKPEALPAWADYVEKVQAGRAKTPGEALHELVQLMARADELAGDEVPRVWVRGLSFDVPILQALLDAAKAPTPWAFRYLRDTRTLFDMWRFDERACPPLEGLIGHRALDDAMQEAHRVQRCLASAYIQLKDQAS